MRIYKYLCSATLLLLLLLTVTACEKSDDLDEIFLKQKWTLSFFREGKNITPVKGNYTITFQDMTFSIVTPNNSTIEGKWSADNKTHSFSASNIRVNNGSIKSDTTATKMKNFIEKATSYGGDANALQIKIQNNAYMQFHNK